MAYACHIQWTVNPEPNIVGYRIYCGATSGIYDASGSPKSVGTVTSAWFVVPTLGTTWYLAVAAVDSDGNVGGLSQEIAIVSETILAPLGTPVLSVR
jgi:hypothetical protein